MTAKPIEALRAAYHVVADAAIRTDAPEASRKRAAAAEELVASAIRACDAAPRAAGTRMLSAGGAVLDHPSVHMGGPSQRSLDLAGRVFAAMAAEASDAGHPSTDLAASAVLVATASETEACARLVQDLLCMERPKDEVAARRVRDALNSRGGRVGMNTRLADLGWELVAAIRERGNRAADPVANHQADVPHSLRLPPGYRVEDTASGGVTWFAPDGSCRSGQRDRVAATDAAWAHREDSVRAVMAEADMRGRPVARRNAAAAARLRERERKAADAAGAPFYYACDEGGDWPYRRLSEAVAHIEQQLGELRSFCDPEWPPQAADLAVYECATETDEPREDGRLVARSEATKIADSDAAEGDVAACEYRVTGA